MRYLFISDFHLGSPLFSNESKLRDILTDDYDKVFLVGDILDVQEATISTITNKYWFLISIINNLEDVTIIKGNHDPSIRVLGDIFYNANITYGFIDEFGIITHGDEFDNFINSFWYRPLFVVFYVFERLGINTKAIMRRAYARILSLIKGKPLDSLLLHYEIRAVRCYGDFFDNIVMGHSHLPKIVDCGNCKYINCGDWIYSKTYVEYIDGEFKLLGA